MEFLANPQVQSILALGALMAGVALAITVPALLAETRKFFATRSDQPSTPLESRVEYLEREIDALAVHLERLGESQRYYARLLEATNPPIANSKAPSTSANEAAALTKERYQS